MTNVLTSDAPALASNLSPLQTGRLIYGDWRLDHAIRRATTPDMADIWLCEHVHTGEYGVLKVAACGYDGASRWMSMERSIRESEIFAMLAHHPRLPRLHHTLTVDSRHAFIRQFIDGPSLADIIREQGPLPERIAAQYALELCDSIKYTQSEGIDNRDISPHNILIDGGKPTMIDCGIAAGPAYPFPEYWALPTGTPGFSPPEQLMRAAVYGTDVWALMATFYFMLAGRSPFVYPDEVGSLIDPAELAIRSAEHHVPDLPGEINADLAALVTTILRAELAAAPNVKYVIERLTQILEPPSLR